MLLTIHLGASKFLGYPELQLADEEAAAFAAAAHKVAEQYDAVMNPKLAAWLQLAAVAGGIYGTRIYAIYARSQQEKKEQPKAQPGPGRVVNMQQPGKAATSAQTPSDVFGVSYTGAIPAEI